MNEKALELLEGVKDKISKLELRNEKFVIELTNDHVSVRRQRRTFWSW